MLTHTRKQRRVAVWAAALTLVAAAALAPVEAGAQEVSRVTPVVLAYRKARPAVVNLSAEKLVATQWGLFGGDPFENVFPSPYTRRVPVRSLGSGVVVHPDGYIITNAHVVRHAEKISVTMADKTKYAAKIISSEVRYDLAVVKVDLPAGKTLPFLPLGRSNDLMVGETAIAIGNPLGYANSLTTGVISAVDRKLKFSQGVEYSGLIQTDAPINPGNSGGPLLNIRGELIGINTAIRADAQNIGFAIPTDTVAEQFPRMLDFEKMNRAVFGATVERRFAPSGVQVYVSAVRKGTPAAGRLAAGDVILGLDGKPVKRLPDYVCGMFATRPGRNVALTIRRDGRERTVTVPVTAMPKPDGKALARTLFGMTLRPVTPELVRTLRLPATRGLLVVGVEQGGPADRIGIQLKDVLFQVGPYYARDLDTLGRILEGVGAGDAVKIGIARGRVRAWAYIHAAKAAARPSSGI